MISLASVGAQFIQRGPFFIVAYLLWLDMFSTYTCANEEWQDIKYLA